MKKKIRNNSIIIGVCLMALASIAGCDDFERKGEVHPEITINMHELNLYVGQTVQLKAGPSELSFSWSSEDIEVATVDGSGTVTAVGEGTTNIVAASGAMTASIPVSSVTRIPLTGFTLSEVDVDIARNARKMVIPIFDPPNANDVSTPEWRSLNDNVATVDYKGDITGWSLGKTEVICTINGMEQSVNINVVYALTKVFKGPHVFSMDEPLLLQFIDFDFGGEGVAYHDNDSGNSGGNTYRATNGDPDGGGVDIGGDLAVGWTASGEWLMYTIEVHDAGDYYISLDLAGDGTSNVRFEIDGENMTGTIHVPRTGGWGTWVWQDVENPITLAEGEYKMRFYLEAAGSNFRTMKFTHSSLMPDPEPEFDNEYELASYRLSNAKDWKIGPWTAMRNPDNRNESWWDFKIPEIMNDVFTFNTNGSFGHDNAGDSFFHESFEDVYPDDVTYNDDGDPESFVTTAYTPPNDGSWEVSEIGGKLILTIKKGFLGFAANPDELSQAQYEIVEHSATSFKMVSHSDWDGWCWEIVPAN